jgi:hypothetical protein
MKNVILILAIGLIVAAAIGGFFYGRISHAPSPQKLTLEQILSIKELHLVKHTYSDLFFLHRKNNPNKAIRAMIQVPVTVTAYIDLKEIQLVGTGDSIRKIILPTAQLHDPVYHLNKMVVRETRGWQLHAGKDLYAQVSNYLGQTIATRVDTARTLAVNNRILIQAEAEALEYITKMLHSLNRTDIEVTFGNTKKDEGVLTYLKETQHPMLISPSAKPVKTDAFVFGFLPLTLHNPKLIE